MAMGVNYQTVPNTWSDALAVLANSVGAIQKTQMDKERQKSDAEVQAENIARSRLERLKAQKDMQDSDQMTRDIAGLDTAPSPEARKEAAFQAEIANQDTINGMPTPAARRAAGQQIESAAAAEAQPNYVQQFDSANKVLGKYGDKAATFLANKRDLADKQILQAGYADQRANTTAIDEANRLEKTRQFNETNTRIKDEAALNRQNMRDIAFIRGGSKGIYSDLSEEEKAGLSRAIGEGRIDPYRVNSRTAKVYAQQELLSPGTDFNSLSAGLNANRSVAVSGAKANDMKIIGANAGMTLLNQVVDPKTEKITDPKKITPKFANELALQCARIIATNNPQVGVEMMREFRQGTLQQGIATIVAYFGGNAAGTTEANLLNIKHFLRREGETAQIERDLYLSGNVRGNAFDAPSITGGIGPERAPATGGWSNEKESRYQELLKKKQAGTLGK
jgi:hypothetical protein